MFCQFEKSSSSKFATLFFNQFAWSISTSSSNQFEDSNFRISNSFFVFFDENNIISLWKRSTKQITFIKANRSNFESLKTTSSFSFLKSKFNHSSQNFCDSHSLLIQRHTHNTAQLNRRFFSSFQQLSVKWNVPGHDPGHGLRHDLRQGLRHGASLIS
jgi:hypothetical protein